MNNQQTNIIQVRLVKHNITSGVSQSTGKEWTKHELITETLEPNPKKIVFQKLGDIMMLIEGNDYQIEFFVESREYNGRWYTNVNIFSINLSAANVPIEQATTQVHQQVSRQSEEQKVLQQAKMDAMANNYFDNQPTPVRNVPPLVSQEQQAQIDGLPF